MTLGMWTVKGDRAELEAFAMAVRMSLGVELRWSPDMASVDFYECEYETRCEIERLALRFGAKRWVVE